VKFTAICGRYTPERPEKYSGNVRRITYRSMWERRFMLYCDRSPKIVSWSSEELHIPYTDSEGRIRNYYPDFVVNAHDGRTIVVEIKPAYQKSWRVNKAKWKSARSFCSALGYEFRVLTEKELF